jgi:hypothetical protein
VERQQEKRRTDAWDAGLTDEQRDQVFEKATRGAVRADSAAAWVAAEYGIAAPSRAALYRFLEWWRPQYVARRVQERVLARDTIREQLAQVGDMSPEVAHALEDQAQALVEAGNYKAAQAVWGMAASLREDMRKQAEHALKQAAEGRAAEALALARAKFEAAERRAEQADQAEAAVSDAGLSEAERAARLREIFGLPPAPAGGEAAA